MSSPSLAEGALIKPNLAHVTVGTIGFSYTSRCTYACDHCSVECSPQRQDKLHPDAVAARIDEASSLGISNVAFTGGECMLYADEILPLVKRASDNGRRATVTTNGFWASTGEAASDMVRRLKDAGTVMLEVSCDMLHANAGARMAHLDNIAAACRRWCLPLGVTSAIRSVVSDEDRGVLNELKIRRLTPTIGSVLPYGTAGKRLPIGEHYYSRLPIDKAPRCPSIGMMHYSSNGSLLPCCGQGTHESMKGSLTDHLVLGHISEPLATTLDRAKDNLFLLILAVLGPYGFVILNEEYGNMVTLPHEVFSTCDICIASSRDERFSDLLAEMAKNREAITDRVYRCYDIINRWGLIRCKLIDR